jgi:hypothetical protein
LCYARYAAAVLFALLAVGFVALWVRSYWRLQILEAQAGLNAAQISSVEGHIAVARLAPHAAIGQSYFSVVSGDAADWRKEGVFGFSFYDGGSITALILPHWFLSATSLGLAALFAFKRTWRYSLRTILVAMMLLAGLLGLAVWEA